MKRLLLLLLLPVFSIFASELAVVTPGDRALQNYLRNETALLSGRCLSDIRTLDDWQSHREEYRRQFAEMLGLSPMPERGDLKPVVTGRIEHEEFTVEKLHFQPSPGFYVTAALYVPKKITRPLPAILLESGHAGVTTKDNVSYGNKAVYQNLGAWFARNGYVCLNPDTLSLGEFRGMHTGTRDRGQWWWNSRGYTPAGVEAWTGIRALDYLCSLSEVDTNRIGICGHSGGGAYSWTVSALDDRVKAAAPIAGLTDLQNQVVDGLLDSHCDCNFFINTYRWDFPQLAALMAPRPLLIGATDKDGLFPVNGAMRLREHVKRIYDLHKASDKLGLVITPGPHEWNAEAQVAVLRWFNRQLKGEDPAIETAAKSFFKNEQLKVFAELPADAINTNIQSVFVPHGKTPDADEVNRQRDPVLATLREKTFNGWPAEDMPLEPKPAFTVEKDGVKFSAWDFTSQHDVMLRIYFVEGAGKKSEGPVTLEILDNVHWTNWLATIRTGFESQLPDELRLAGRPETNANVFFELKQPLKSGGTLAFFAPRGVGLAAWSGDEKVRTRIRRRFMVLGQTVDGMQVWDIRRAVQMVHFVRDADTAHVELRADGTMGVNAAYAALFEPGVRKRNLTNWPATEAEMPDYLNATRYLDLTVAIRPNSKQ